MFTEKLQEELQCAISAIYGDQEEEMDKVLANGGKLTDVINEYDLADIFRKMKFYIFD